MATVTWNVNKDARIARRESDNWDAGSGTSDGLPVGLHSGYRYRALIGFSYSFTGMTAITSAVLHYKTSNQIHVAFGSDPDVRWQRITASWSEGSSNGLSASNAVIYPGPAVTTTNAVVDDITTSESTWGTADITGMIQDAFAAGVFYGIRAIAWDGTGESDSSTDVTEFFSQEYSTSSDMYIVVTYTTVSPPEAPTVISPTAGGFTGDDTTPDLTFRHNDDDGNASTQYQVQVSTDPAFGSTVFDSGTVVGVIANGANFTVTCTTTLTRGTQYYMRARSADASGWGPYSAASAFKVPQLPTATLTEPSATGRLAKLSYTGGSGAASPSMNTGWSFSCPDGGSQSHYEVEIYNDSAGSVGSLLSGSTLLAGTNGTWVSSATLTEGNYYHVRARVKCSHGVLGNYTSYFRVRARWGVVVHRKDLGSVPTSWSISTLNTTVGASSAIVVEYGSASAANASPTGGWYSSIASVTLRQFFYYRAWLLVWGASPATTPTLDRLTLSYSATILLPDKWSLDTGVVADPGAYVYGTQSLQITADGVNWRAASQVVTVTPNTNYVLSARMRASGNPQAHMKVIVGGDQVFGNQTLTGTSDWDRYQTAVFNSGANTSVTVQMIASGPGSTAGAIAWYDAVKLEASTVVTPWSPSFLADAVVLDAGGLQIDAAAGGIMRLRGSAGGTRDRVDLGANGLKFGGDVQLSSPSAGTLKIDNTTGSADQALQIGDDVTIYDVDVADAIGIKGQSNAANGEIIFGSGKDTNIKRGAANTLKTDDDFTAARLGVNAGVDKVIQSGSITINMGGAAFAGGTITFPTAFDNAPIVMVTRRTSGSGAPKIHVVLNGAPSTSSVAVLAATGDGTTSSSSVTVDWVAIDVLKFI